MAKICRSNFTNDEPEKTVKIDKILTEKGQYDLY